MLFFPRLFSHGGIRNSIIGGWSLGGFVAFISALGLEVCCGGPCAVFALDCRIGLLKYSRTAHVFDDQRNRGGQIERRSG